MFMTKHKREHLELEAKVKFLAYDRILGDRGSFRKDSGTTDFNRHVYTLTYLYPWEGKIQEVGLLTYEHYNFTHFAERKFKYTRFVSLRTENGTILHFSVNTEHGTMVRVEVEEIVTPTDWMRIE